MLEREVALPDLPRVDLVIDCDDGRVGHQISWGLGIKCARPLCFYYQN